MHNNFLNRRGSISILVMCVGTLILFIGVLLILHVSSSNINSRFDEAYSYGSVYVDHDSLENSLHFVLVESFLNSYQKTLAENSEKIGYENVDLNHIFGMKIAQDVNELRANTDKNSFGDFLRNKGVLSKFDGNSTTLYLKDGWIESKTTKDSDGKILLNVDYSDSLNVSVNFSMLYLLSLDEIVSDYCKCVRLSSLDLLIGCVDSEFGAVPTKEVDVRPDGNVVTKFILKMETVESYFINGKMDKIRFNLNFDPFADGEPSPNLKFCQNVV